MSIQGLTSAPPRLTESGHLMTCRFCMSCELLYQWLYLTLESRLMRGTAGRAMTCCGVSYRQFLYTLKGLLTSYGRPPPYLLNSYFHSFACRPEGRLRGLRFVFQNSECLRQYGLPRPEQVISKAIASMPDSVRQAKIDWFLDIIQVCMQTYAC